MTTEESLLSVEPKRIADYSQEWITSVSSRAAPIAKSDVLEPQRTHA